MESDEEQAKRLKYESVRHLGAAQALARAAMDVLSSDEPTVADMETTANLLSDALANLEKARVRLHRSESAGQ